MELNNSVLINNFPPEFAINSEKKENDYGKQYAKAIWGEWSNTYYKRKKQFEIYKEYIHGKHPIEDCKKPLLSVEYVKEEMLNVDFSKRVKVLPKFMRKMYNGIDMSEFSLSVYALDPTARDERERIKKEKEKLLHAKDFILELQQLTGQQIAPEGSLPQSQDQIDLEEELSEPMDVEKAEQLGIKAVLMDNNFPRVQELIKHDIIDYDLAAVRVETNKRTGIVINRIHPSSILWEPGNMEDSNYYAEVKSVTIRELCRIAEQSGIDLTNEYLQKLSAGFNHINYNRYVNVLFFCFRTSHEDIYKRKINRKTKKVSLIKREEYNPKQPSDISQKITSSYDVWYEGAMVLDNENTIVKYQLVENLPEYQGKITPPYIVVSPREGNPIVSEVKDLIDEIQTLDYKRQHLQYELKGNLTEIDADTITDISLDGQNKLTPEDVLAMYYTRNIVFRKTRDSDGEDINARRAVSEMASGIPYALREVMNIQIAKINELRDIFGLSTNDDVKPNEKTLMANEPYRLSDNVSMKDIPDACFRLSLETCKIVSARLNDIFKYSDIKQKYINMIGMDDIKVLEKYKKNRSLHYFGVDMEYIPTREERMQLTMDLNTYIAQGKLDPIDAQEIKWIKDTRLSYKIARKRISEREKAMQQFEMDKINQPINGNIQATQVANEEKRKTLQVEYELKAQLENLKLDNKAELEKISGAYKLEVANITANAKANVNEIQKKVEIELAKYKKDRDEETRIKAQNNSAENQAKLVKLRRGEIEDIHQTDIQETDISQL